MFTFTIQCAQIMRYIIITCKARGTKYGTTHLELSDQYDNNRMENTDLKISHLLVLHHLYHLLVSLTN